MPKMNDHERAAKIRLEALKSIYRADFPYFGGCLSVVEIIAALYYDGFIKFDSQKPGWDGQDYFILSKFKAAPVLYTILADLGFFDKNELNFIGKEGALLKCFSSSKVPGINATVKESGVGLSVAVGLALSLKMERKSNKVFVLMDEEELQKGTIWEAATMASENKLDNLTLIVDKPFIEVDASAISLVRSDQIQNKFEAFGWKVFQLTDGHNFDKIHDVLNRGDKVSRMPKCIWAHTIAGKGIDFVERKPGYLHARISEGEMTEIISKFNFDYAEK